MVNNALTSLTFLAMAPILDARAPKACEPHRAHSASLAHATFSTLRSHANEGCESQSIQADLAMAPFLDARPQKACEPIGSHTPSLAHATLDSLRSHADLHTLKMQQTKTLVESFDRLLDEACEKGRSLDGHNQTMQDVSSQDLGIVEQPPLRAHDMDIARSSKDTMPGHTSVIEVGAGGGAGSAVGEELVAHRSDCNPSPQAETHETQYKAIMAILRRLSQVQIGKSDMEWEQHPNISRLISFARISISRQVIEASALTSAIEDGKLLASLKETPKKKKKGKKR